MARKKVVIDYGTVDVRKITLMGFGIALNVVGAFLALTLRLPIYLDSIGTVLVACLLGPKYAVLTGLGGSMVSGITFDVYSFYFAPVQISTGLLAGLMYQKGYLRGKKIPFGVLVFALPTAILSAIISAGVFGGITSSGSTYIVQLLRSFGVSDVMSVFMIQVFTDYLDEYVAVMLVMAISAVLPSYFKGQKTVFHKGEKNGKI